MSPNLDQNSLVSVIMPVKYFDKNIYPAINSILNQTIKNLELIMIGSDISKSEIDVYFNDDRIFIVECDGNISKALNMGLAAARGKYIMRMDSDDFCDQIRLEVQLEALIKENVDVVGCNMNFIDDNNKLLLRKVFPEKDNEIKFFMPINVTLSHSAMLTYKRVFEKVGQYNENLIKAEDLDLFLRMINYGINFHNVQKYLYFYRIKKNMWKVDNLDNKISYNISSFYINNKFNENREIKNYDHLLQKALLEYYKGSMKEARSYLIKYLKKKPNELFSVIRYLIISMFIGRYLKTLRKYNIPQKFNLLVHKYFGFDLQYKSKL